jgi:hypothetical protein
MTAGASDGVPCRSPLRLPATGTLERRENLVNIYRTAP